METFGDALIVQEIVAATGQGPFARLYHAQWEAPQPERSHPWRGIASVLSRLVRAFGAIPTQRKRTLAGGASS